MDGTARRLDARGRGDGIALRVGFAKDVETYARAVDFRRGRITHVVHRPEFQQVGEGRVALFVEAGATDEDASPASAIVRDGLFQGRGEGHCFRAEDDVGHVVV